MWQQTEHELGLRLLQLQTPTQISCVEECLFQQQPAQFGRFVCKKYQARLLITADQLLLVHNFASSGQWCWITIFWVDIKFVSELHAVKCSTPSPGPRHIPPPVYIIGWPAPAAPGPCSVAHDTASCLMDTLQISFAFTLDRVSHKMSFLIQSPLHPECLCSFCH